MAMSNENIQLLDEEDENLFAQARDAGHKLDPRAQKIFVLVVVLLAVYFVGLIIPKDMLNSALHNAGYASGYSFAWFLQDLQENVNGLVAVLTGNDNGPKSYASLMIRYVVIALSGAGLAVCGAVYQGTFKNALVSPSTLGVMSGATLGMMVWVVFFVNDDGSNVAWLGSNASNAAAAQDPFGYLMSSYSLAILSFVGCLLIVSLVLLVMRLAGGMSGIMMIITGQVIGGITGAISNTIRYYYVAGNPYGPKAQLLTDLAIASFYRQFTWIDLIALGVPLIATFAVVMHFRQRMMALSLSAEETRALGVDTKRMRIIVVGLCTLLTAIIVSFCGTVGFVGFLVPHLARRLVGPNFTYLLPMATVMGAVFVLTAYILMSATLGPDYETMVGMFISIGGATVFLVTALSGKGGSRGQFQ
ncbi:MAG: iron ABC transporter permease [Coriobacteriia bacterium]|nr:iron ABC transporter permease [Coriobacteriia bacterium]